MSRLAQERVCLVIQDKPSSRLANFGRFLSGVISPIGHVFPVNQRIRFNVLVTLNASVDNIFHGFHRCPPAVRRRNYKTVQFFLDTYHIIHSIRTGVI